MPDFRLSARSVSSGIQKKFAATRRASAARSFFCAISARRWRKASKLGSLTAGGKVMGTGVYGPGAGAWMGGGVGVCAGACATTAAPANEANRAAPARPMPYEFHGYRILISPELGSIAPALHAHRRAAQKPRSLADSTRRRRSDNGSRAREPRWRDIGQCRAPPWQCLMKAKKKRFQPRGRGGWTRREQRERYDLRENTRGTSCRGAFTGCMLQRHDITSLGVEKREAGAICPSNLRAIRNLHDRCCRFRSRFALSAADRPAGRIEYLHDARLVWASAFQAGAARGRDRGELADRLHRILHGCAGKPRRQRRLIHRATQDHPGGGHVVRVRRVFGPLSEGADELELCGR